MIRRIFTLIGKDFRIFWADPVAVGLGFVVPAVMILVFGMIFSGSGEAMKELTVLAVNEDQGPAGARLLRDLNKLDEIEIYERLKSDTTRLDSVRIRQRVASGKNSAGLIVPRDFSEGLKKGEVRLFILEDPRDPFTAGVLSGMLQRQVFSTYPGLMPQAMMKSGMDTDSLRALAFGGDIRAAVEKNYGMDLPDSMPMGLSFPDNMILGKDPDSTGKTDSSTFSMDQAFTGMFKVKREAVVGKNTGNSGVAQSVAGLAVMFMLFAVGAIAASLLREMRYGTGSRLRVCGVSPGELLFSKYFYAVLLGGGQLIVMMLYGRVIFGLNIFAHPFALLLVIVCSSLVMSGVGLFIAAISRSEEQAVGFQITLILAMSAVGGAMFPSFMIPKVVRSFGAFTPVHWAMQGFLDVFWRAQGVSGILFECAVLTGMAALLVTISVLIFRKRLRTELG
ncbi:ABC transporter permease [candidate division KSB1 bacterium]|nr:MAG: ABC transporter permease [candidate division KSB1 bacterium]